MDKLWSCKHALSSHATSFGCDCFAESCFVEASGEDVCPACCTKDGGAACAGAEHQKEGKPIPAEPKRKPKRRKVKADK